MYDLVPVKLCCHLLFAVLSCNVFLSSFTQTCSYQTHLSMVQNCGNSLGWERPNKISQFIPSVCKPFNSSPSCPSEGYTIFLFIPMRDVSFSTVHVSKTVFIHSGHFLKMKMHCLLYARVIEIILDLGMKDRGVWTLSCVIFTDL